MGNLDKENKNALSDDELENVTGGLIVDTLVSRVNRERVMIPSTLEDKKHGGKKPRRGVRLQTLENRPDDAKGTPTEWL